MLPARWKPSQTSRPAKPGPGPATAGPGAVFNPLIRARVQLLTGRVTVPPYPSQLDRHFLAPTFVAAWSQEIMMPTDPFFGPSAPTLRSAERSTAMDIRSRHRQIGRRAGLSSFIAACPTARAKARGICSAYWTAEI